MIRRLDHSLFVPPLLLLLVVLLAPGGARGQGFAVTEQSTCMMGRGSAGVAHTCADGSAIFFNPAGLVGTEGYAATAGVTFIAAGGAFIDDRTQTPVELQNDPIPVPHAYVRYGRSERLAFGLGVYVPYGLGTKWPASETFEGRFLGYDNSLQSIYVQPTVAYEVLPSLRVGAGLTVVFSSVSLNRRLDLSQQPIPGVTLPGGEPVTFGQLGIPFHTAFGDASLEGSGVGFGGNFGVQYEPTDWLAFGARFLMPVTIQYDGTVTFERIPTNIILPPGNPISQVTGLPAPLPLDPLLQPAFQQGGPLVDQAVQTGITMPAQFVVGVSVQPTERLLLAVDYQWMGWSTFDRLVLDFENEDTPDEVLIENYENTSGVRLGAAYDVTETVTLRAGFITHEAAAPDRTVTPLLPEAYRNEYAVGLGWQTIGGLTVNLAYHYIDQNNRRGRVRGIPEDTPVSAVNSGLYRFDAHLFAATLTYRF